MNYTVNPSIEVHKIIAEIYEVAGEPERWQELIKKLFLYLEDSGHFDQANALSLSAHKPSSDTWKSALENVSDLNLVTGSENQSHLMLLAHFNNALKLIWQISQHEKMESLSTILYDKLPIGLILFNKHKEIRFSNQYAKRLLPHSTNINTFVPEFDNPSDKEWLESSLQSLSQSNNQDSFFCNVLDYNQKKLTFHICNSNDENLFILFVGGVNELISKEHPFFDSVNLTNQEKNVALELTSGKSINEIAENSSKSPHTIRTQVKNILSKTQISRQVDLIQLIQTFPFFEESETDTYHKIFKLKDGRQMSYCIYGDDNTKDILYLHSAVGSRLELPSSIITRLVKANYRVICIDRPNYGFSEPDQNKSFTSISDDILACLTHLNARRVNVIGYTMGGVIACKLATYAPSMINRLFLISSGCQPNQKEIDEHYYLYRMGFKMLTHMPKLYLGISALIKQGVKRNPKNFVRDHFYPMTDHEKNHPQFEWLKSHVTLNVTESVKSNNKLLSTAQEGYLYSNHWCFDLSEIQQPCFLVHGKQDKHTPVSLGKKMAEKIPNAQIEIIDNYGTFLMFYEQEFIANKIYNFFNH